MMPLKVLCTPASPKPGIFSSRSGLFTCQVFMSQTVGVGTLRYLQP